MRLKAPKRLHKAKLMQYKLGDVKSLNPNTH